MSGTLATATTDFDIESTEGDLQKQIIVKFKWLYWLHVPVAIGVAAAVLIFLKIQLWSTKSKSLI